jgi:hypothetical protein
MAILPHGAESVKRRVRPDAELPSPSWSKRTAAVANLVASGATTLTRVLPQRAVECRSRV